LCVAGDARAADRSPGSLVAAAPSAAHRAAPLPLGDPAREALRRALDAALSRKRLRGARAGAIVVDITSGETLYERDADTLFNPASVSKVLTTAAALRRLGPEFRFVTFAFADSKPRGPVVRGHIYVKGSGDPKLTTEGVFKLAAHIAAQGIREVRGDLVVDESYFDAETRGAGWDQDASDRPYQAPVGAASVNFNALEVKVFPGAKPGAAARVLTDPPTRFVRIDNQAKTAGPGGSTKIVVRSVAEKDHNVLRVRGRIALRHPGWSTWRKVDHPARYFGTLLHEMLARLDVRVRGRVRVATTPASAEPVARHLSPQLSALVADMNKVSQNFMAEQVLKSLGAQTAGAPGSWPNGIRAVEDFLAEIGVARGTYVFRNGSGLNDVNRLTPRQVASVLFHMYAHFGTSAEFVASLAVAGADGSVKRRMRGGSFYRRLRVKTGWLRGVSCLAGYSGGGRPLAFALFLNGVRSSGDGHAAQRRVARALTAFPASGPPREASRAKREGPR
jgi:D-alanyl-D-alanine carboxypeptidase/D-alanyl-D-alanine-endopeptidase (penicillin-binding protein 4)